MTSNFVLLTAQNGGYVHAGNRADLFGPALVGQTLCGAPAYAETIDGVPLAVDRKNRDANVTCPRCLRARAWDTPGASGMRPGPTSSVNPKVRARVIELADQGLNVSSIAYRLTTEEVPLPSGQFGLWHPTQVRRILDDVS